MIKFDDRPERALLWLLDADPIADAIRALATGDTRLLGVADFAVRIPVTQNHGSRSLETEFGLRVLEGTSDCIFGEEHLRLNIMAREYARVYNDYVIANVLSPSHTRQRG